MKKNKEKKIYRCYHCGEIAKTREHAPPKSFFPPNRRINLTKVPSCEAHNNDKSHFDDYVFQLIPAVVTKQIQEDVFRYQTNKIAKSLLQMKMGQDAPVLINQLGKKNKNIKLELVGDRLTYSSDIDYVALDTFFISLAKAVLFHESKKIIKSENIAIHYHHLIPGSDLSLDSKKLLASRPDKKNWSGTDKYIFKYHISELENNFFIDMEFYESYEVTVLLKQFAII